MLSVCTRSINEFGLRQHGPLCLGTGTKSMTEPFTPFHVLSQNVERPCHGCTCLAELVVVDGRDEHRGDAGRREGGAVRHGRSAAVAAAALVRHRARARSMSKGRWLRRRGRGMVKGHRPGARCGAAGALASACPQGAPVPPMVRIAAPRIAVGRWARCGAVLGQPSPQIPETDPRLCPWAWVARFPLRRLRGRVAEGGLSDKAFARSRKRLSSSCSY